jgi:hypothetical protein
VRDDFAQLGYLVTRSPQSRSPWDLIVIGKHLLLLVQCKTNGKISAHDWNVLFNLAESVGARAMLACRVKRKLVYHELTDLRTGLRGERPWVQVMYPSNPHHVATGCVSRAADQTAAKPKRTRKVARAVSSVQPPAQT